MSVELSIVLPCRNEEKALPKTLDDLISVIKNDSINAEIVISDSSSDSSRQIIGKYIKENKDIKIRLIKHDKVGYGNALQEGFNAAKGKYVLMADADCTYDFRDIPKFLAKLYEGYDFVIGDRFKGRVKDSTMPWLHRVVGNPLLSFIFKNFFGSGVADTHCGIRAIVRRKYNELNLKTTGMEYASEMIIKAYKNKLKIAEFPVPYHPRVGESKLSSFRDGWRHIKLMLIYSPLFLFMLPGFLFFLVGVLGMIIAKFDILTRFGIDVGFHSLYASSAAVILGYQLIVFAIFAKTYAVYHLGEKNKFIESMPQVFSLNRITTLSLFVVLIGFIGYLLVIQGEITDYVGSSIQIENGVIFLTVIVLGIQTFFTSFMLSILGIKD